MLTILLKYSSLFMMTKTEALSPRRMMMSSASRNSLAAFLNVGGQEAALVSSSRAGSFSNKFVNQVGGQRCFPVALEVVQLVDEDFHLNSFVFVLWFLNEMAIKSEAKKLFLWSCGFIVGEIDESLEGNLITYVPSI